MKTIKQGVIIGAFAFVLASAVPVFAIEGLQISVQCSNVVLRWPSDEFSGETYIVQRKSDLTSTNPWITLTNYMPPDSGTNITLFIHSNVVQNPCNCGGSGGGSFAAMTAGGNASRLSMLLAREEAPLPTEPMVMPADGKSRPLPLVIYPPGFDISGMLVYDPTISDWVFGSQYVRPTPLMSYSRAGSLMTGDIDPPGGDSGGSGTDTIPETGFYRVVRNGAHLWALTNGTTLSGTVTIPVEAGNDGGTMETVTFQANNTGIPGVEPLEPPFSLLSFQIDTTRLNNGDNYLVAEAAWNMATNADLEADDLPTFVNLQSPSVQVVVSNEISFPNWVDEFGSDSMSFDVVSIYPDADWQINIYDSHTNYIGSFSDHTSDGQIHVVWGITNSQGASLNDDVFYSDTSITPGTGGP